MSKPSKVLVLMIIIIGGLGLPYLYDVDPDSAFIFSSSVAFLYFVGVDAI